MDRLHTVVFVTAVVAAAAPLAHAGLDCDSAASALALEQLGKGAIKVDDPSLSYIEYCAAGDNDYGTPKTNTHARVLAACTAVIERIPSYESCVVIAAQLGKTQLGKRDVFEWVSKQPLAPWTSDSGPRNSLFLFRRMADPRAAALIVAAWRDATPKAAAKEKQHRHDDMMEWSSWRQSAAAALGATGGADDQAFLDSEAKATKDVHVSEACRDAIAAIEQRTKR